MQIPCRYCPLSPCPQPPQHLPPTGPSLGKAMYQVMRLRLLSWSLCHWACQTSRLASVIAGLGRKPLVSTSNQWSLHHCHTWACMFLHWYWYGYREYWAAAAESLLWWASIAWLWLGEQQSWIICHSKSVFDAQWNEDPPAEILLPSCSGWLRWHSLHLSWSATHTSWKLRLQHLKHCIGWMCWTLTTL